MWKTKQRKKDGGIDESILGDQKYPLRDDKYFKGWLILFCSKSINGLRCLDPEADLCSQGFLSWELSSPVAFRFVPSCSLQVVLSNSSLWADLLGSRDFGKSQQRCQKGAMKTSNLGWVCLLGRVWLFAIPGTAACQTPLSSTISQSLLKFVSIELVMLSSHLILCSLLLLLPSIFPTRERFPTRVFSNESALPSYPVSRLFASGGRSIGTSASATVLSLVKISLSGWKLK